MDMSDLSVERTVSLVAGSVVIVSLVLGRVHSKRWRVLTALVGINLLMEGAVGWCPLSLALNEAGVRHQPMGRLAA